MRDAPDEETKRAAVDQSGLEVPRRRGVGVVDGGREREGLLARSAPSSAEVRAEEKVVGNLRVAVPSDGSAGSKGEPESVREKRIPIGVGPYIPYPK